MDVERHCQQIDSLLPWYVNRTLRAREAENVQAHLEDCDRCRGEAEWLAQVGTRLRDAKLGPAKDSRFPALHARIRDDVERRRRTRFAMAAGVVLALALGVVLAWQPLAPRYHTVTDAVPPATDVVMMELVLQPDAPLSSLYGILERHNAVIVSGPAADGRVMLEFRLEQGETKDGLLRALKADPNLARTARVPGGAIATDVE